MPLFEYECPLGHRFSKIVKFSDNGEFAPCPQCSDTARKILSLPSRAIIRAKEQLPYGSGSRGRFIPAEETGGRSVFVPSFGSMEKEEVDYVTEVAVEQEKERIAKNLHEEHRDYKTKEAMANIVKQSKKAPEGKRKETMERILKEGM